MKNKVSKELREVWELKEACYNEVKDLPIKEALKKRISDSIESTKKLGFEVIENIKSGR